jgi:hypothetical protein
VGRADELTVAIEEARDLGAAIDAELAGRAEVEAALETRPRPTSG